jgi:hypothetical protein
MLITSRMSSSIAYGIAVSAHETDGFTRGAFNMLFG